jgi:hypothetical protein
MTPASASQVLQRLVLCLLLSSNLFGNSLSGSSLFGSSSQPELNGMCLSGVAQQTQSLLHGFFIMAMLLSVCLCQLLT